MEASLASILEINIEDVPDLGASEVSSNIRHLPWQHILNNWLKEKYNLQYIEMTTDWAWTRDIGYHIISGASPRLEGLNHAVVGLNGKMIHDPIGPEGAGVKDENKTLGLFFKRM